MAIDTIIDSIIKEVKDADNSKSNFSSFSTELNTEDTGSIQATVVVVNRREENEQDDELETSEDAEGG